MRPNIKPATISATTLQREVGSILRRVGKQGEHIIVERGGFPVAVLIPVAEHQHLLNK